MAISLNNMGQVIEITPISWDGVPLHIPKFQIYAIIPNPLFTSFHSKDGKRIPLIDVDQYQIPVLEPYGGLLDTPPNFAVVMSHHIQNEFSLYAYPADTIEDTYSISYAEWLSEQSN
ncbi:MAG: hypothetical protein GJ671_05400 [Alteromonadaceae bacterium]|nr:hypothetical protein [Alteromonadaceae bacterium]